MQQAKPEARRARGAKRRKLIGAIDQGTSSTRFLVFENQTGHLLASSQIEIKRIVPKEGWVEMEPEEIMDSVYKTIANVQEQLNGFNGGNNSSCSSNDNNDNTNNNNKLECIGICNQRESTVVWDKITGKALYNVIIWMDNRTKDIVDQMIDSVPGRDFNWLKDKTGLPMSTYFSAFKLKWLIDNVEEVKLALKEHRLLFGTVDSWILWNLTGKHLTDVTNASRTFLMDIETLEWDKTLCKYFNIPLNILPKILSSADDFGEVQHGPLKGLPITGVIGDQSAALFGHNCLQLGQTKATFGTGCFIMQNIGPGPLNGALSGVQREAKRGLVTTVGYKLRDRPAYYALEGSIKIAGAALTWLRDNMQLIGNYDECDKLINTTSHSAGVFFVPALGGLYSPYWDPNAAGLFIGLSQFTRREHLVRATFDSIAFQTNDILSLMRGVTNGLMIDGGLCKSDNMSQILADITGCEIVRPSMCETSALGAAMVAGSGAGIWSYEEMLANSNTPYEYSSSSNQNHHYPHESLHYEDHFSSIIQSKNCFQGSAIRTSACNLDAGGGVNDDAGGGIDSRQARVEEHDEADYEDYSSRLIGTGTQTTTMTTGTPSEADDDEATSPLSNNCVNELGAQKQQHQQQKQQQQRQQAEDKILGNGNSIISNENGNNLSIVGHHNHMFYQPPSSGYSSGDNFESTTNADEDQLMRRDSPISSSQVTDSSSTGIDDHHRDHETRLAHKIGEQQLVDLIDDDLIEDTKRRQEGTGACSDVAKLNGGVNNSAQVANITLTQTETTAGLSKRSSLISQTFQSNLSACLRNYICPQSRNAAVHPSSSTDRSSAGDEPFEDDDEDADDGDDGGIGGRLRRNDRNRLMDFAKADEENVNELYERSYNLNVARQQLVASSKSRKMAAKPVDVFQSYISLEHRTELVDTWRRAVERSMQWTKIHHEEVRKIDYQRLASLPISMYLFFSIGMVALSGFLSASGGGRSFLTS